MSLFDIELPKAFTKQFLPLLKFWMISAVSSSLLFDTHSQHLQLLFDRLSLTKR